VAEELYDEVRVVIKERLSTSLGGESMAKKEKMKRTILARNRSVTVLKVTRQGNRRIDPSLVLFLEQESAR
jgi:hypothetical protein